MVHKVVVLLEENEYRIEFILPEYNEPCPIQSMCSVVSKKQTDDIALKNTVGH